MYMESNLFRSFDKKPRIRGVSYWLFFEELYGFYESFVFNFQYIYARPVAAGVYIHYTAGLGHYSDLQLFAICAVQSQAGLSLTGQR